MEASFQPPVSEGHFWCLVLHFVGSGEPTAVIGTLDGHITEDRSGEELLRSAQARSTFRWLTCPCASAITQFESFVSWGITAGLLFPGLDGACEELRARFFGF